jgi:hypothetical protein
MKKSLGVGDIKGTFAVDLTRSRYLCDGEGTPIDGLEHTKGTIVRSKTYGRDWYVNGELLDIPKEKHKNSNGCGGYPLISIKGEMEITSIVLKA